MSEMAYYCMFMAVCVVIDKRNDAFEKHFEKDGVQDI